MLTSYQIRAARSLLGWPARVLAKKAGVHITTVQRLEHSPETLSGHTATIAKIQEALETAGVEFIEGQKNGAGPGVRLKVHSSVKTGL